MQLHIGHVGKGKSERSFRTVKDKFFNTLDWDSYTNIDDIQKDYDAFLKTGYLNSVHSSLKCTPRERFMKDIDNISRETNEFVDEAFLHRIIRNVRKDSTISFRDMSYEVPTEYIKDKVTLKYLPENYDELFLYENDKRVATITAIDKIANSKRKRNKEISMYREENNNV